ncbi:MAG: DUF5667 domain-containing protein [Anaerolineales bacterium]|nr:DUF5667 domain-containing protein [Anaerolineales bacterium]
MNVIKDRFDPDIERKLSVLGSVPPRDSESAASGRKKFLTEARTLTPPVLNGDESRDWIGVILAAFVGIKRSPALTVFASFALVLAILLGGTSATVYAAQGSMPDQVLYSVKLLSEDLRLVLTSSPQAELELTLDLIDRRLAEIDFLVEAGDDVPDSVVNRMEVHLDQALNIAVAIEDNGDDPVAIHKWDRDILRDQDRTEAPEKDRPQSRNEVGKPFPDDGSEGEPSEQQPVSSGEGGSGEGSEDAYDPYHNPDGPPYGPGQQLPADPQGSNWGSGPQPEEPPASAWGPGPGGQCDEELGEPCEAPYGPCGYQEPLPQPSNGPGPGGDETSPDPSSGDGGDSSGDSSGDSGSGSSGEDGKAP